MAVPEYPNSCLREPITCEAVGAGVTAGDQLATRVLDEACEKLSAWLGSLLSLLDPDIVVTDGGVSRIRDVGILGSASVVLQN